MELTSDSSTVLVEDKTKHMPSCENESVDGAKSSSVARTSGFTKPMFR